MNSAANLLLCAADLMALRGHCNDGPGEQRREVCALEAIAMAAGGSHSRLAYFAVVNRSKEAREAVTALAALIGREKCFAHAMLGQEHADSFQHDIATVYSYNDKPERTRDEMIAAMRGAAAILKAKQSSENAMYHLQMACV